jgi:hypothetical protein
VCSLDISTSGDESNHKETWTYSGLGTPLGELNLGNGMTVDMGWMMMRNQWNTEIRGHLWEAYESSLQSKLPGIKLNRNRISGPCDSS